MSSFGLIEYKDANPAVKAVYDDIIATCKTDYINESGFPIWISDSRMLSFSCPQDNEFAIRAGPINISGMGPVEYSDPVDSTKHGLMNVLLEMN